MSVMAKVTTPEGRTLSGRVAVGAVGGGAVPPPVRASRRLTWGQSHLGHLLQRRRGYRPTGAHRRPRRLRRRTDGLNGSVGGVVAVAAEWKGAVPGPVVSARLGHRRGAQVLGNLAGLTPSPALVVGYPWSGIDPSPLVPPSGGPVGRGQRTSRPSSGHGSIGPSRCLRAGSVAQWLCGCPTPAWSSWWAPPVPARAPGPRPTSPPTRWSRPIGYGRWPGWVTTTRQPGTMRSPCSTKSSRCGCGAGCSPWSTAPGSTTTAGRGIGRRRCGTTCPAMRWCSRWRRPWRGNATLPPPTRFRPGSSTASSAGSARWSPASMRRVSPRCTPSTTPGSRMRPCWRHRSSTPASPPPGSGAGRSACGSDCSCPASAAVHRPSPPGWRASPERPRRRGSPACGSWTTSARSPRWAGSGTTCWRRPARWRFSPPSPNGRHSGPWWRAS